MNFSERPASTAWEYAALPGPPEIPIWLWFRPEGVPEGVALRVAETVDYTDPAVGPRLTVRNLLPLCGLQPHDVFAWSLFGQNYDAQRGLSPYLDSPLPAPAPGFDGTLYVYAAIGPVAAPIAGAVPPGAVPAEAVNPFAAMPNVAPVAAAAPVPAGAVSETAAEALERMEIDWVASVETEADLVRLRKQLDDARNRVKALNRDFTPDERVHSSPQEKKDWLAARRALHECELRISQCIKEHDIGYATSAGQREWFEQTFDDFVQPRRPFEGLEQAGRQFEVFRKIVSTLQTKMKTTLTVAKQDGERRAQAILTRVAARIREAQTKKNFLGVMMD